MTQDQTLATMKQVHERCGQLLDPHTAIGVAAALREREAVPDLRPDPMVVLGTAHPAKFPDAVEQATGVRPPLPEFLADLELRSQGLDPVETREQYEAAWDAVLDRMRKQVKAEADEVRAAFAKLAAG